LPVGHLDNAILDIELERGDKPTCKFAYGQTVTHRKRAGTDETLPAFTEAQSFNRTACRVGAIEDPNFFAAGGCSFEHVAKCGYEGVYATAEVLQVDEQDVESVEHVLRRSSDLTVETEYGDAVLGIRIVGALDHVVLLIAA
jgi:hypothetical protein